MNEKRYVVLGKLQRTRRVQCSEWALECLRWPKGFRTSVTPAQMSSTVISYILNHRYEICCIRPGFLSHSLEWWCCCQRAATGGPKTLNKYYSSLRGKREPGSCGTVQATSSCDRDTLALIWKATSLGRLHVDISSRRESSKRRQGRLSLATYEILYAIPFKLMESI